MAPLHVTFSYSAAGSLQQAFETLGLDHEILALNDDYSLGPIARADRAARRSWLADARGYDDDELAKVEAFWERVAVARSGLVAWTSSRSACESCGLLELISRIEDAPLDVIDVAEVELFRDGTPSPFASRRFACVRDDQIVEAKLIERAVPLSDVARAAHRASWERLTTDDTGLRVRTPLGLSSVPITYFDPMILSCVTNEWQKSARIVGDLYRKIEDDDVNDGFIFDRLVALVETDVVEGRTDQEYWSMHDSWVRTPR